MLTFEDPEASSVQPVKRSWTALNVLPWRGADFWIPRAIPMPTLIVTHHLFQHLYVVFLITIIQSAQYLNRYFIHTYL
jgi:hypothetical protein